VRKKGKGVRTTKRTNDEDGSFCGGTPTRHRRGITRYCTLSTLAIPLHLDPPWTPARPSSVPCLPHTATTTATAMPVHRLLVGTHASAVHLIEFDSTAHSLVLKHSLELAEQTSWIALSPSIPGLFYVNSWSTDRIFAVRVEEGGFVVLSETTFVGEGPTHFEVEEGGAALVAVNVRLRSVLAEV
jgi:hypothetical protein